MSDSDSSPVRLTDVYRDFNATIHFIRAQNKTDRPVGLVMIKRGNKNTFGPRSYIPSTSDQPAQSVDDSPERAAEHLKFLTNDSDHALPKQYNDWQLGITCTNGVLDVDFDGTSPLMSAALQHFLPPSLHKWGREGYHTTHWLYMTETVTDGFGHSHLLRTIKSIKSIATEIRHGNNSNLQTVLPGSVSPSKLNDDKPTAVRWINRDDATQPLKTVHAVDVLEAIRKSAAAALIAEYWVEGQRHNLIQATSGMLYRMAQTTEGLEQDFVVTKEFAWELVYGIMTIAGDEEINSPARKKSFESTWTKAEQDYPVTGATTIEQITGDAEIKRNLYSILSNSPNAQAIEEFLEQYYIWGNRGHVIDIKALRDGEDDSVMKRPEFVNAHGYKKITVYREGKEKTVRLADMIFELPNAKRVHGLTFKPTAYTPGTTPEMNRQEIVETEKGYRKLNRWTGFAIPPWPKPVTIDDIPWFHRHVNEIVAREDETTYNWVMSWIAHIFQNPQRRAGTVLVLVGDPGTGKTSLGEFVIIPIIGDHHAKMTDSLQHLIKDFNVEFDAKLFVQCEEATNSKQIATANKMKTMITGSTMRIEPKGVNPYEQENLMRFMFTSNQIEDAVYLSEGSKDRRYTILEVSKKYTNDRKNFWNPYYEWCKNKDNLAKVHRFLLDWKIDWDFISMPLSTHAKRRMQEHSASIFHRWLANRVAAGHILTEDRHTHWHSATINGKDSRAIIRDQWCDLVNMNDVANCYNDYARNWNKDRTGDKNPQQILTLLRDDGLAPQRGQGHEVFKSIGNGVRRKLKVIASHDEFIRVLYQKYGFELDEFRIPEQEESDKKSGVKEKF